MSSIGSQIGSVRNSSQESPQITAKDKFRKRYDRQLVNKRQNDGDYEFEPLQSVLKPIPRTKNNSSLTSSMKNLNFIESDSPFQSIT